jgi:uncharacterized lipoprotein YbaY
MTTNSSSILQRLVYAGRSLSIAIVLACCCMSAVYGQWNTTNGAVQDWFSQAMPSSWNNNSVPALPSTGGALPSTSGIGTSTTTSTGLQQWKLGIAKSDRDVGTLITDVMPDSPAARAGLKRDDLVVAINGQQVGNTPTRGFVDIGVEVNRTAVNGQVIALVADARSGQLRNITINLEETAVTLSGTARLIESIALPSSNIMVELRNVSRPLYETAGGRIRGIFSGSGPLQFQMKIDPRTLQINDRYQLVATIADANNVTQYVGVQDVEIARLINRNLPTQVVNLENIQRYMARNGNSMNAPVVQASYMNEVDAMFQRILGTSPTPQARNLWIEHLSKGNSIDDLKARLVASADFYDRAGNNPSVFVSEMIRTLTGGVARSQDVTTWMNRLVQLQGNREQLVREFMSQTGIVR